MSKKATYWCDQDYDGRSIPGNGIANYRHVYAFFDPDTKEPFYTQTPIITFSFDSKRHNKCNLSAGVGFNSDFVHQANYYAKYASAHGYSKQLPFKAKTIYYYGNTSQHNYWKLGWITSPPSLQKLNVFKDIPDYDIIVETRIQCLTCKNVDSYKQWLCRDGGGDHTCSNFGIYNCKCGKTKMVLFLRNMCHYIPTEDVFAGHNSDLHSILEGKHPVITNFPPEVEAQYNPRRVQSSNDSIFPAVIISAILGGVTGGLLGAAGVALLPSVASASSSALIGVNIAASATGSVINTITSGGNIGVNVSYNNGTIKANDVKDIAINYARDTTFYYLNSLNSNSSDYRAAMICKRLQSLTDVSSKTEKEMERENQQIWLTRGEIV